MGILQPLQDRRQEEILLSRWSSEGSQEIESRDAGSGLCSGRTTGNYPREKHVNPDDRRQAGHVRPGRRTNVAFTFILVSSLFLLWGFCNGMIDVMDKHFQEE